MLSLLSSAKLLEEAVAGAVAEAEVAAEAEEAQDGNYRLHNCSQLWATPPLFFCTGLVCGIHF